MMSSMGMSSTSRRENMRDGRLHLNWFEMNQKNKPQSNALATGDHYYYYYLFELSEKQNVMFMCL